MISLTYFHSLVLMGSESIIPEWLFKTTIVIEPERIEFKAPSRIESFGPIAANVAHELHVLLTNEGIGQDWSYFLFRTKPHFRAVAPRTLVT